MFRHLREAQPQVEPHEALVVACGRGKLKEVQRLKQQHPDLDLDSWGNDGNSPLGWAAFYGRVEVVRQLLEWGADVNGKNLAGTTAAHEAARNKQLRVLWLLAEHGAELEVKGGLGQTPFKEAQQSNARNIVSAWAELLAVSESARREKEAQDMPDMPARPSTAMASLQQAQNEFVDACGSDELQLARTLFEEEMIDPNGEHSDGGTALTSAASRGNVHVISQLVVWGADVDRKDRFGESACHNAVFFKQMGALQRLAELGADLNANNNIGKTPLEIAQINNYAVVQTWDELLVISKHAKMQKRRRSMANFVDACSHGNVREASRLRDTYGLSSFRTSDGKFALGDAAANAHTDMVDRLLDWGADVDQQDDEGNTAAHRAAAEDNLDILQMLAMRGADLLLQNAAGRTPREIAEAGSGSSDNSVLEAWDELVETSVSARQQQQECAVALTADPAAADQAHVPDALTAAAPDALAAAADIARAISDEAPTPPDFAVAQTPLPTPARSIDELQAQVCDLQGLVKQSEQARRETELELRQIIEALKNDLAHTHFRLAALEAAKK